MRGFYLQKLEDKIHMTNEELIQQLRKEDDEYRHKFLMEDLFTKNIPLIKNCINNKLGYNIDHFCNKWRITYDDLFSAASVGLWKAIKSYKIGEANFFSYAKICITNELLMFMRSANKKNKSMQSFDEHIYGDKMSKRSMTFGEVYEDENDVIEGAIANAESARLFNMLLNEIGQRDLKIFYLSVVQDMKQQDIADLYGLGRERISKIIKHTKKMAHELYHVSKVEAL